MRSCSDGAYNWIGHYKDHFSKFSILWAQRRKCAQETIDCIERFVFAYLGVPKILQSDNGRKFDNEVQCRFIITSTIWWLYFCVFRYSIRWLSSGLNKQL